MTQDWNRRAWSGTPFRWTTAAKCGSSTRENSGISGSSRTRLKPCRRWAPSRWQPGFDVAALSLALANRKAPVKALLLEQSVIAGLGNLYADEALFVSGIHPERRANTLSGDELSRLHRGIVDALSRSTDAYAAARDAEWPDPPTALAPWTIPRRAGEACPRCGEDVALLRVRNRSTWFCPACQPAP